MRILVVGPPAVGKSSTIRELDWEFNSRSYTIKKMTFVDFEAFDPKYTELIDHMKSRVVAGSGGFNPRHFAYKGWTFIYILPELKTYVELFKLKQLHRGVGTHTLDEAMRVYRNFSVQAENMKQNKQQVRYANSKDDAKHIIKAILREIGEWE